MASFAIFDRGDNNVVRVVLNESQQGPVSGTGGSAVRFDEQPGDPASTVVTFRGNPTEFIVKGFYLDMDYEYSPADPSEVFPTLMRYDDTAGQFVKNESVEAVLTIPMWIDALQERIDALV